MLENKVKALKKGDILFYATGPRIIKIEITNIDTKDGIRHVDVDYPNDPNSQRRKSIAYADLFNGTYYTTAEDALKKGCVTIMSLRERKLQKQIDAYNEDMESLKSLEEK